MAPVATVPSADPATTTTLPLSPLNSLLVDPESVLPEPVVTPTLPTRLVISGIGVDVPVRDIGLEPDGQLEIPDETEVGWYRLGSAPGRAGSIVIAGHVSWNDTVGPFFQLASLEPGQRVDVDLADGSARTYEVVERAQYPKQELPPERIWARDGPETLVLITCGGDFNTDIRRYRDNIVVYAVPVA